MAGRQKYYAVRKGRKTGIFRSWDSCKEQIHGYPAAEYKSFPTQEEANRFLMADQQAGWQQDTDLQDHDGQQRTGSQEAAGQKIRYPYAFVDGSYNQATKTYGYGGFLCTGPGQKEILQGNGTDPEMASMRNVAGEVEGSMAAVRKALELELPELTIYFDYMGISMWARGEWKRNKKGTAAYYQYMQEAAARIRLIFVKVKGHSGVEGNEEADRLAKQAVGISVR